jgi:hypothetical protein
MEGANQDPERLKEKMIILKRYAPHIEWPYPNEVKQAIKEQVFKGTLPSDQAIPIDSLAKVITDAQLEAIVHLSPYKEQFSFRGKFYTIRRGGIFELKGAWDEVKQITNDVIKEYGKKGYALLKALVELQEATFGQLSVRASEIYGENYYPTQLIAQLRDKWDLAWEVGSRQYPRWAMPEEIKPAVKAALSEFEATPIPRLSTSDAEHEFIEVIKMDQAFKMYLRDLMKNRLEEALNFGKRFTPSDLISYLQSLYGEVLFYDHLLSITQQYSVCDAEVLNLAGEKALNVGFNLALFGEAGTGKTFATKDMILGSDNSAVPPHGLPGINRYAGGMTPAKFIAIGEAYVGRKFNFIIPEFNDWFKYRGMVEPLKLAMERGNIQYETKTYTVGPYRFSSFFSVNYNTRVSERGYEVTVRDPNFNAIEDRMLCRLHRLTKQKYQELARSQMELMLGKLVGKMNQIAPKIRDHLTLVYAIETADPLIVGYFNNKKVTLTKELLTRLEKAREAVLEHLNAQVVPFSMRLERRALQLASAMSLVGFFNVTGDVIPIDDVASKMAVQFFVEEAYVRSNEGFPLFEVLKKLSIP